MIQTQSDDESFMRILEAELRDMTAALNRSTPLREAFSADMDRYYAAVMALVGIPDGEERRLTARRLNDQFPCRKLFIGYAECEKTIMTSGETIKHISQQCVEHCTAGRSIPATLKADFALACTNFESACEVLMAIFDQAECLRVNAGSNGLLN